MNRATGAPPTQRANKQRGCDQTAQQRRTLIPAALLPRTCCRVAGDALPQLHTHTACQLRYCMSFDVRKLVIMTQTLPDKIQTDMLSRSFVVQFDAATSAADRHLPNHSLTHSSAILDGATGKTGGKRGQCPPPGELTRAIPA